MPGQFGQFGLARTRRRTLARRLTESMSHWDGLGAAQPQRRRLARRPTSAAALGAAALAFCLLATDGAHAATPSTKKGIWCEGAAPTAGAFRLYRALGVGLCSLRLPWASVAGRRPSRPRDPRDPAYAWPPAADAIISEAQRAGLRIAVEVQRSPAWANGGRPSNWIPRRLGDYADYMAAAARRYPEVDYWVIWAEPSRRQNWMPLSPSRSSFRPLNRAERRAPRTYARLLDKAYAAIKKVRPRARVVGGNTFTVGDISPFNWIRYLRLPNGRPPRMDLYGHHPFTARRPDLRQRMQRRGFADFSDLDRLAIWLDHYLGPAPDGRPLRLFLGEWTIPTARNSPFNFWVTRGTQAAWIRAGYRIARRWRRVESLVWLQLDDGDGSLPGGLIDGAGRRKPGFEAFRGA